MKWALIYEDTIQRIFSFGCWHIRYDLRDGSAVWLWIGRNERLPIGFFATKLSA